MRVPDFDGADRDRCELIGWVTKPGDIVLFHGMTVHGGSGRLPATMRQCAISTQWLGEDARLVDRPGGHDPHWLPEFAKFGLGPGDYRHLFLVFARVAPARGDARRYGACAEVVAGAPGICSWRS